MKCYRKQPVEAIQWDGDPSALEALDKLLHNMGIKKHVIKMNDSVNLNLKVGYTDSHGRNHQVLLPLNGWVVVEGKTLQFYKDKTFRQTFKPAEDEGSKVDDKSEPSILDLARQTDKGSYKRLMEILDKSFEGMAHSKRAVDYFVAPAIPVSRDIADAIKKAVLRSSNKTYKTNTDDVTGRMRLKECSPFISETLDRVRDSVEKAFNDKIREGKYKSAWEDSEGNIHYNESTPEQIKLKAMYKEFMDNYKKMLDAWIEEGIEADANKLQKYAVNKKDVESDTFDSVLDEMKELHTKKNKDYKGSFHDLFMEYGMPYALGHLEEKLNRAKAITENGGNAVKNEHIEDSVIDMACYAVMLYVELKNKEDEKD